MAPKTVGEPDEITGQSALPSKSQTLLLLWSDILTRFYSCSNQEDYPVGRGYRTMFEQRNLRYRNGYRASNPLPPCLAHRLILDLGDVHPIPC